MDARADRASIGERRSRKGMRSGATREACAICSFSGGSLGFVLQPLDFDGVPVLDRYGTGPRAQLGDYRHRWDRLRRRSVVVFTNEAPHPCWHG